MTVPVSCGPSNRVREATGVRMHSDSSQGAAQGVAIAANPAMAGRGAGDVAMVYDFLLVPGGAEQVTLHALRQHPDWSLVTAFVDPDAFTAEDLSAARVHTLTSPTRRPGWQALKVLRAFERHADVLAGFDRVLFSGVYAPAAVRHRAGGNLYYCHTPPRFAYDLGAWYLRRAAPWQRPALRWLARRVRRSFADAMQRMDRVAANSHTVRARLERHLGLKDVQVIHPPVDTAQWTWGGQDDFYLSSARLEPYKRVEGIVRAFMTLPARRLVVASGGSSEARLRRLAHGHDNITFTGWCTPQALRELTGRCIATLYLPREEDFGLSPVESMAAGKPVIGVDEGGLRETVLAGLTGHLLPPVAAEDPSAIREAVLALDAGNARAMRGACEARAREFDAAVFDQALARFMEET